MPRIDGSKEKWADSASKAMLRGAILRGTITNADNPKTIYNQNEEHKKWKCEAWRQGLKRLLTIIERD